MKAPRGFSRAVLLLTDAFLIFASFVVYSCIFGIGGVYCSAGLFREEGQPFGILPEFTRDSAAQGLRLACPVCPYKMQQRSLNHAKKVISLLVAVMAAALMATGLTSCGQKREAPVQSTQPTQTLEEYYETDEIKDVIAQIKQSLDSDDMSVDTYARGSTAFYDFTIHSEVREEDLAELKERAIGVVEQMEPDIQRELNNLNRQCSNEDIAVQVRYIDSTGRILYAVSYPSGEVVEPEAGADSSDEASYAEEARPEEAGETLTAFVAAMNQQLADQAADGSRMALQEYVETDAVQTMISALNQQFEEQGASVALSVEEDSLNMDLSLALEYSPEAYDALIEALKQQEDSIQEIGKLIGTHCTNGHIELWFGTLASDGSNLTQNVYIITNS